LRQALARSLADWHDARMAGKTSIIAHAPGTWRGLTRAIARAADHAARQSVARIAEVSDTMRMISASSQRMGEIVSVIDSIAFQTNILALNASVEAARAGEQGRGFAVVASEVRNLAQRSAASAKEIKALIDDSMEKVKHGDTLVAQAESIVRKMGENTEPVISLVGEIAQASQEQSEGIAQINMAITQIDSTTQQNAALVEEAAAAAASLREQAAELVQTVQHFELGQGFATGEPAEGHRIAPEPVLV